jgi:hypothetical protein
VGKATKVAVRFSSRRSSDRASKCIEDLCDGWRVIDNCGCLFYWGWLKLVGKCDVKAAIPLFMGLFVLGWLYGYLATFFPIAQESNERYQ